jgi:FMN phosphatase YigB (HAD superfamily)
MTITLLLDLDNTLLHNNIDTFIPAYLKELSGYLSDVVDPNRMSKALLSATQLMVANNNPGCRLKEVFDESFYPAIGITEKQMTQTLESFYSQVFPSLIKFTSINPAAIILVKTAFERGYRVAIATNPLFPRTAILQRLAWAGLPANEFPFALIPSYETFHFAKPNPAFFTEFLAQLGWEEGPVIMVGDDMINDIEPTRMLGISAAWVKNSGPPAGSTATPTIALENIGELLPWLDSISQETLQPVFTSPRAMLAILKSTPAALDTLLNRLDRSLWNKRVLPGEWCITEILCHLRDVDAEVNIPRLIAVMTDPNPFLPGMDTDPWADQRGYINQDCDQALESFLQTRAKIIACLESLSDADWQRTARHAIFGPTRLFELVDIIAGHDRLHIQQVQKNLSITDLSPRSC